MPTIEEKDIAKGIDSLSGKNKIPEGKAEDLENFRPRKVGKLETRRGVRTHIGVSPSGSSKPIRGAEVYKSELEEYPVIVADGKVYQRTTGMATTTIDIEADLTADFSIGPAFYINTVDTSTVKRTGGAITGTNISGNLVNITGASYNSSLNQATYTLSITDRAFINGAASLSDVIKTTSDTLADWITITQMGYSEYNGTFEIVSVSEVLSGTDSTITLVVNNAQGDDTTPSEADAGGFAELATNIFTTSAIGTLAVGDELVGVYDDNEAALKTLNNTVTVRSISGNVVAFNMYEDEFEDDGASPGALHIRAKRTTSTLSVASISGFTSGNVVSVGSYNRTFRTSTISGSSITVDESIIITHGDAVAEPYFWQSVTVPGGTGDLIPSAPTQILAQAPTARIRTANIQDSVYMTNGTDNVMKYDGTNVYRAGLLNWDFSAVVNINTDQTGIVLDTIPFSSSTQDPNTSGTPADREITLTTAENLRTWTKVTDARTNRVYNVVDYDSSNQKISLGSIIQPLPDISYDFTSSDVNTTDDTITIANHNLTKPTRIQFSTTGTLPTGISASTDYYVYPVDADTIQIGLYPHGVGDVNITAGGSGTHTLTTQDNKLYVPKVYSYYYKLSLIDVNDNIIASFANGHETSVVEVITPSAVEHTLTLPPAIDQYDYDRIEVELFRTKADTVAPFYRIRNVQVTYDSNNPKVTIIDAAPDGALTELDSVSTSIKGAEIPTATNEPPISQYLASVGSRLVLGNIKTNDLLDINFNNISGKKQSEVNSLTGTVLVIADSDTGDSVTINFKGLNENYNHEFNTVTFSDNSGDLQVNNLPVTIRDDDPIQFASGGGTLPSNITANTTYYLSSVSAGAGTALLKELKGNSSVVAFVDTGSGTLAATIGKLDRFEKMGADINRVTGIGVLDEAPLSGITNDSGDMVLTFGSATERPSLSVGDRIRFIPRDGTTLTGNFYPGLTPFQIYYIIEVVTPGIQYKISNSSGGAAVPFVATIGSTTGYVEYVDMFFIKATVNNTPYTANDFTAGEWVTIQSYEYKRDFLYTGGGLVENSNKTQREFDGISRFTGVWKIDQTVANSTSTKAFFKFVHDFNDNPANRLSSTLSYSSLIDSGDYQIMCATASTTKELNIITHTTDVVEKRLYRDNQEFVDKSDVFLGVSDLIEAFNGYQRSLSTPWAFAYRVGNGVRIEGAKPSSEISVTITVGNDLNLETYINGLKQTSGSGQKRLFPSRLLRSYENFPEIFDNPFTSNSTQSDSIIDLNPADGQVITGMASFFSEASTTSAQLEDVVIVAKTSSIFAVNVRTREWRKLESGGQGCTAPDSMEATPTGVLFANDSGIYRVTKNLEIEHVGEDLEGLWKTVNKSALENAVGIMDPHDKCYKLAVPTGSSTVNDTVFCYDHEKEGQGQRWGAWFKYDISNISTFAASSQDLFMGTEGGDLYQTRNDNDTDFGDYQDASAEAITATFTSRVTDFGDSGVKKKVLKVLGEFDMDDTDASSILVETAVNSEDLWRSSGTTSISKTNTSSLAQEQSPVVGWSPEVRNCHRIQTRVTHGTRKEKVVLTRLSYSVKGITERGSRQSSDVEPS